MLKAVVSRTLPIAIMHLACVGLFLLVLVRTSQAWQVGGPNSKPKNHLASSDVVSGTRRDLLTSSASFLSVLTILPSRSGAEEASSLASPATLLDEVQVAATGEVKKVCTQ
jgi:hypothetical protein